jgi:Rrf2 family iron-sulfur cluster assembly transcriptional regulator
MLSKGCIYGIQAALYLASQKPEGYVSIRQISDSLGLSYPFLTKVLQQLTRRGLMRSLRGPRGGVALAKPLVETTLVEIVEAIDGRALFDGCILGLPECRVETPCALHDRWKPLRDEILTTFSETSVLDLITPVLTDKTVPIPK